MFDAEARLLRIVNFRAHNIGRQHIGRELDAVELGVHQRGQRFERERFSQTGNAFEQNVALHHQRNQQAVDQVVLADQIAADLAAQRLDPMRCLAHQRLSFRRIEDRRGLFVRVKCHDSISLIL